MSKSEEVSTGFSSLGIHNFVYQDDFCPFAAEIRNELLHYPHWTEMRQASREHKNLFKPYNQNGITTGHLSESWRERLPHCLAFRDLLWQRQVELCQTVGVRSGEDMAVEMNAMAYGEGAWLSLHTDAGALSDERVVAWMLYLTDPSDGEWLDAHGGAVRLVNRAREEVRLRPKFNRFAMFSVSSTSFHEIEQIAWKCGWTQCRLALSGWLTRSSGRPNATTVYLHTPDFEKLRAQAGQRIEGSLALYNLMREQRAYCGLDVTETSEKLYQLNREYESHLSAPKGTYFLHHAPGPAACIVVLDENREIIYFGSREGYPRKLGAS